MGGSLRIAFAALFFLVTDGHLAWLRRARWLLFFGTIINYVDRQVLSLLKPSIEAAYARMKEENPGPLDDGAIVRLFERVIDESRRLERIRTKGL